MSFLAVRAGVRYRREGLQELRRHGGGRLPGQQDHRGQLQRSVRRYVRCRPLAVDRCRQNFYFF